jgi:hypothetical protein
VLLLPEDDRRRGEFAQQVERAVQRSLSELGFAVNGSTLPFRDAQLAAGCTGTVRECGAAVAAALDSEELLVSRVEDDSSRRYATLTLLRFAPRAAPRAGTAQLPRAPAEELQQNVLALVQSMFSDRMRVGFAASAPKMEQSSLSAPLLASSAASTTSTLQPAPKSDYVQRIERAERHRRLLAIGWPTLSVGAGLMVGGLIANLAAHRESRAYESLAPSSRAEVDAKLAHYRAAEDKASTARILWGIGGGLAAAGAFVLLWERFGPSPDRKLQEAGSQAGNGRAARAVRLAAAPSVSGFALTCTGEL